MDGSDIAQRAQVVISEMDVYDVLAWTGLLYVIFKQFTTQNRVTWEADNPVREHKQRILTGLFYVPFVSLITFRVQLVMKIFIMVMIFQGLGEYMQIVFLHFGDNANSQKKKSQKREHYKFTLMDRLVQILSVCPGIGFFFSYVLATAILYNCFFLIILMYLIILIFSPKRKVGIEDFYRICLYWFGIMWISWPLSHTMIIFNGFKIDGVAYGSALLVIVLLTSWISDVAGFYVGKKLGNTKAMPHISPNKSIEGFIAQLVFGVGLCLFFKFLQTSGFTSLPPSDWIHYVALGFLTAFFGAFGDTLESFIKRMGGVKDSGIFFPGHGGILDRFDTFLLACPTVFYYVTYVICDGPEHFYT